MITVVCSVRGECCAKSHLKVVNVPTDDPERAARAARRYLEHGDAPGGWDVDESLVLPEAISSEESGPDANPDFVVPEDQVFIWSLTKDDRVRWNDPDDGVCSRILTVADVKFEGEDSATITDMDGSDVGCCFPELEEATECLGLTDEQEEDLVRVLVEDMRNDHGYMRQVAEQYAEGLPLEEKRRHLGLKE